jgi:nucleoid-associated protein YgaU
MATITLPATAVRRTAQRTSRPVPTRTPARRAASSSAARTLRPTTEMPYATGDLAAPTLVLPLPVATSTQAPLRLTRRGRRLARTVVILLAVVTALVLSVAGRGGVGQAGDGPAVPATNTVVVQPGQTLWQVARSVASDADPRETVARIQELNGLSGADAATLRPGQTLIVPAAG